jgi:hypothetical protein
VAGGASEIIPYVDGALMPFTQRTFSDNTNGFANDLLIFMSRLGSTLFGAGNLDEIRVYRRALTAGEVGALWAANAPGTSIGSVTSSGTSQRPATCR